jgi:hypothetical protein
VIQQEQVFKLTAKSADGEPLVGVPISARRTKFGSAAGGRVREFGWRRRRRCARRSIGSVLAAAGRSRSPNSSRSIWSCIQAEPVTIAKLRWLLGKAPSTLGEKRLADLSSRDVHTRGVWRSRKDIASRRRKRCGRFSTLRSAWSLLEFNQAKRVPNPQRRPKEKRPFESWAQIEGSRCEARAGVRADGDLRCRDRAATVRAVRARVTRRRSRGRRRLRAACSATAIRNFIGDGLTGAWTLGGRRSSYSSPLPTTKGAD